MPAVETLEKFARALEVPVYLLFYEGSEEPSRLPGDDLSKRKGTGDVEWGSHGIDARLLTKFRRLLAQTDESNRRLLLFAAQKMAIRGKNGKL